MNKQTLIKSIFKLKKIAVVGMSPNPERPSHYVSLYMKNNGFQIIPVNPGQKFINNEKCYSNLKDIPFSIDIVNVFRRSEYVLPIMTDALKINTKAIWLQDGIISEEAAKLAKEANIMFIMNDCMLRQHQRVI